MGYQIEAGVVLIFGREILEERVAFIYKTSNIALSLVVVPFESHSY
jgi:hypothetical protein